MFANYTGPVFQGVAQTRKITGLARDMLYRGAKTGEYPHIKSGNRVLFNVPALLDVLEQQARNGEAGQ